MGKMSKVPKKSESITPDEKKELLSFQTNISKMEREAQEAVMAHQEAQTEFSYTLMTLRRKYQLRVGDSIDPLTGLITRV